MGEQPQTRPDFRSPLGPLLTRFLEEKRACGYRYDREAYLLRALDRFLLREKLSSPELPRAVLERWTDTRAPERPRTHRMRRTLARQLAQCLVRQGCRAYIPPVAAAQRTRQEFTARIFSRAEMRSLLTAADRLPVSPGSPRRHLVMPEVFRLLYGCGLRVGEVIHLSVRDVDLPGGVLTIRHGKFRQDRLVPVEAGFASRLRRYAEALGPRTDDAPFFPSPRGGAYGYKAIYCTFRQLLRHAGIPHAGRGRGPRLHEMRHAFAIHRLERWYREGVELNAKLVHLSTYMGHRSMVGTQAYLQLTHTLFLDLAGRLERTFGHAIPRRGTP
jgi:integrase